MASTNPKRILITGGGTFLGDSIAAALLAENAEVTLLVRPGAEDHLGPLQNRVRWYNADAWDVASLRGRARGHGTVIHTIGSLVADPARGLSCHRLNLVPARNATNMCISDGVPHIVLLTAAAAPWISQEYLNAKRDAESYVRRVGLRYSVIRAPILFARGQQRALFFRLMSAIGGTPPLSWTPLNRIAPLPVDVLARGVARIVLDEERDRQVYYASDLRRRNSKDELRGMAHLGPIVARSKLTGTIPYSGLDEDVPFGWAPPAQDRK